MFDEQAFSERFAKLCEGGQLEKSAASIGLLNQKSLHGIIKDSINPDRDMQERRIGRHVADVFDGSEIFEVQTKNLYSISNKLESLLNEYPVTVVLPIIAKKYIYWLNPETGAAEKPVKSPKSGGGYSALPELSGIQNLLNNSRLTVCLVTVNVQEYRIRDGYGKNNAKRATKLDLVPTSLCGIQTLSLPNDLKKLMPPGLDGEFCAAQFIKNGRYTSRGGYNALKMLKSLGVILPCGKIGRAQGYRINENF